MYLFGFIFIGTPRGDIFACIRLGKRTYTCFRVAAFNLLSLQSRLIGEKLVAQMVQAGTWYVFAVCLVYRFLRFFYGIFFCSFA